MSQADTIREWFEKRARIEDSVGWYAKRKAYGEATIFTPGRDTKIWHTTDDPSDLNEITKENNRLTLVFSKYNIYSRVIVMEGLKTIEEEVLLQRAKVRLILKDFDRMEYRSYECYQKPSEKLIDTMVFTEGELSLFSYLTDKERGLA